MNTDPWTRAPWVGRWPGHYPSRPRVRGRWGSRRPWWSSLPALRYPSAPASGPHTDCAEGNESGAHRISSSGCCRQHLMERNRGYQYPVSTGRHQFLLLTQRSVLIQWYQSSASGDWLWSQRCSSSSIHYKIKYLMVILRGFLLRQTRAFYSLLGTECKDINETGLDRVSTSIHQWFTWVTVQLRR